MEDSHATIVKGSFLGQDLQYTENVRLIWEKNSIVEIEILDYEVDQGRGLAIPSFINGHIHIGDSFLKDLAFHETLVDIVKPPNGIKHTMLSKTDEKTILKGMINTFKELWFNGQQGFIDFRENGLLGIERIERALDHVTNPILPFIFGRPRKTKESIEQLAYFAETNENILGLNISSPNGWNDELINFLSSSLREKPNLLFSTHVSETGQNAPKSQSRFGLSDTARILHFFKALQKQVILVHLNFLVKNDIDLIRQCSPSIVFCPRTASLFGNINFKKPPYKEIMEAGVNCALGTDNVMLNAPDLFQEMNFFTRLLKSCYTDWKFDPREILKMVTINPARAVKMDHQIGSIEEGKDATFFIMETAHPTSIFMKNPYLQVILRAHPGMIKERYYKGQKYEGII